MPEYLGLDTSNYTTSTARLWPEGVRQEKKLLPVKAGEAGLRQSDAVFHHTRQLPQLLQNLCSQPLQALSAIGVTTRPRNRADSYMPCFLCGSGTAHAIAAVTGVPVYETSHQIGHVLAALYGANALSYLEQPFLAFHVSGGTTDSLLCTPHAKKILEITPIGTSLDLKAGQAIDRVGLMLGLQFPCGKQLEQLAQKSQKTFRVHPTIKGVNCCLSGLQNQCDTMQKQGALPEDIACYCMTMIRETIYQMTQAAWKQVGTMSVLYAGGVMSNLWIRPALQHAFGGIFTKPEFSCDNAVGAAVFAALQEGGAKWLF